ncbi:MAG: type IIA DNA topoisomerase subunit B, partial [Lentisphaeria bacterium]|nr:type IIA DNA topoisomerase subunit B [Lentisphaeria bacterium]
MVEEQENDLLREQAESYSEDDIKTLQGLEHIRQRPGMYIGRLGDGSHQDDGIYVLFKEVLDNAIDEYVMGYGRRIDVAIEENTFTIRDYGRGIPPGKLVDCVSNINTGGKFNSDKYQFTVGMNGVGTKA